MDLKKLIMLVFLSSPVLANDANQGDFSNNTQAETITTTTSTVVSQEGTPVPTAVAQLPQFTTKIFVLYQMGEGFRLTDRLILRFFYKR